MSDAELILIGGLLLGSGIAAAMVADRVRVPGLILFLGLGMLVGSEGPGGVDFDDVELTRTLGTVGLVLILFEGGLTAGWQEIRPVLKTAISLAIVGTLLTAAIGGLAAVWLFDLGHARGADRRLGDRRHRLRRDLRRPPRLEAAAAARAGARGRVGDERPGRGPARHRLHRLDRGARLRPREHGSSSSPATSLIGAVVGVLVGWGARWAFIRLDYPTAGPLPGRLDGGGGALLRPRRRRPRLGVPRRLPDRPRPRDRDRARPAHGHRLPPGPQLGRADLAVLPARPARLPERSGRRRLRGHGAGPRADLRRPPDRDARRHPVRPASGSASG